MVQLQPAGSCERLLLAESWETLRLSMSPARPGDPGLGPPCALTSEPGPPAYFRGDSRLASVYLWCESSPFFFIKKEKIKAKHHGCALSFPCPSQAVSADGANLTIEAVYKRGQDYRFACYAQGHACPPYRVRFLCGRPGKQAWWGQRPLGAAPSSPP